jgi:hypothetical protein
VRLWVQTPVPQKKNYMKISIELFIWWKKQEKGKESKKKSN